MKHLLTFISITALAISLTGCGSFAQLNTPKNSANKIKTYLKDYDMTGCAALTNIELQRLRRAWNSTGDKHTVIVESIAKLDEYMGKGLNIPPEGGQHNQWYQCEQCQMHLETVDSTHHKCPTCGKVYSGWPYDNVLYNHTHHRNASYIYRAAVAYAITGKAKYKKFATDLMLGYAELYTTLPRIVNWTKDRPAYYEDGKTLVRQGGHVSNQTLNEAMLMVEIASGLDILKFTEGISSQDLEKINTGLIRPMITSICGYKAGKSNWQTWHNAAMVYASAVLQDKQLFELAMNDTENGFYKQMEISVLDDGMWYENSWGYHYYTLRAMTNIAEGARRLGVNLYDQPELKSMYMAVFDYILPDDNLPMFGDATAGGGNYTFSMGNEAAYEIYQEPALAGILPDEPDWYTVLHGRYTGEKTARPTPESIIKYSAGHAILRSEKDGQSNAAILVFGPYGGFHGHYDKLSFIYVSGDDTIAIDHGRAQSQAYRLPIHKQWYKSTLSHNTIMLDSQDQKGIEGKCLQSRLGSPEHYSAVSATADGLFGDKASITRFLMTYKNYLVVIDQIKSLDAKPHRIDWLLHSSASAAKCDSSVAQNPLGLPEYPGSDYLQNVKHYDLEDDSANIIFANDDSASASANICIDGADKANIICADGPFASVVERSAATILNATGTDVIIASVMSDNTNSASKAMISKTDTKLGVNIKFSNNESCEITFDNGQIADGFTVSGIK